MSGDSKPIPIKTGMSKADVLGTAGSPVSRERQIDAQGTEVEIWTILSSGMVYDVEFMLGQVSKVRPRSDHDREDSQEWI